MKSGNKHMCFFKGFVGNVKKTHVFLTFWDKTGVPDDAKISQEEEPEDQEDNTNKEIKKNAEKREINK